MKIISGRTMTALINAGGCAGWKDDTNQEGAGRGTACDRNATEETILRGQLIYLEQWPLAGVFFVHLVVGGHRHCCARRPTRP